MTDEKGKDTDGNEKLSKKLDNAPAVKGNAPVATVIDQLKIQIERESIKRELAQVLPKHITPDRLLRSLMTQIRQNPTLLKCSAQSLLGCAVKAAEEGLDFSLGQAYCVPYNVKKKMPDGSERWVDEAQYQRGYQGLMALARRSGEIVDIQAHPIYRNDVFRAKRGFESELTHELQLGERGELVAFYAYYVLATGGRGFEVMSKADVDKIRERSKAKNSGPWVTDYEEMGRKTVMKRMCKYLPKSTEFADAVEEDDRLEFAEATGIELNLGKATAAPTGPVASAAQQQRTAPKAIEHTESGLTEMELPKQEPEQEKVAAEAANAKHKQKREQTKQEKKEAPEGNLWDYVLQSGPLSGSKLGDVKNDLADLAKELEFMTQRDREMVNLALAELNPMEA